MIKKTDIHLHLAPERRTGVNGTWISSAEDMIPHLESLGIHKGIVLSAGENTDGQMCSNREAQAIHQAFPETYAYMCNIDEAAAIGPASWDGALQSDCDRTIVTGKQEPGEVNREKVYKILEYYKNQGAVGIGEFTINRRIDDPLIQAVFAAGEKLKLPITFHMSPEEGYSYGIVDEPGLPLLEKALLAYPDAVFVGHSPAFWIEISGDAPTEKEARDQWGQGPVVPGGRVVELFQRFPNLYGDLSANSAGQAVMRDPEFGLNFLERFSDRLMFGTDMLNTDMVFPLGAWLDQMAAENKLSREAYEKIVCGNARRVYGV